MREKYDLEKELTISLSQARAAVLMDICARCAGFGLAPEEEHVLREIEAAVEARIDFILDPDYGAILADIRSGLRREIGFGDAGEEGPSGPAGNP
ncbi:MAG: hypothetical protein J0I79_20020 [Mesorhizobium sp.]|uniref:hypothetical protein n=1 Tax=Mesorhizobium sp. TaxID=1871066 RepID=UPI001AC8C567|nr:hypothetical protein [Mesorhizobium sp.]MBN9220238.1 hypothetical protein [Mesorhizobium sp.]